MSEINVHILELMASGARTEEKVIHLERYVVKDLKDQLNENGKRAESRFRWTVALVVTFTSTSIAVPLALCGGI